MWKHQRRSETAVSENQIDWRNLLLEPVGAREFGPCPTCGQMTQRVWGFVHSATPAIAAYYVQWASNNPEHGANFDLIIGKWGERAEAKDRQAV